MPVDAKSPHAISMARECYQPSCPIELDAKHTIDAIGMGLVSFCGVQISSAYLPPAGYFGGVGGGAFCSFPMAATILRACTSMRHSGRSLTDPRMYSLAAGSLGSSSRTFSQCAIHIPSAFSRQRQRRGLWLHRHIFDRVFIRVREATVLCIEPHFAQGIFFRLTKTSRPVIVSPP